ncbi:MAG TPA: PQQ-binding-like beta-propeller repeat protein, partial [Micromonosporaceae bacterium]
MAGPRHKGRVWRSLFMVLMIGLIVTVLITTHVVNPGPWWNDFVHKITRLSDPDPQWTVRIDGKPDVTGVLPNANMVVVASRGFVEGYQTSDGKRAWHKAANWAYPAVDVVVSQPRPENPDADPAPDRGFAVLDPRTGDAEWSDPDATAVWIYALDIVDLTCPDSSRCVLRDRYHDGSVRWELELPGTAHTIRGPNPHLAGVRDPAGWFGGAAAGTAPAMPPIMPLDYDDKIHVVDTAEHRVVREAVAPDRQTRVAFLGDRMLYVRADRGDAGCTFQVQAFDILSGAPVWTEDGFDLDTARGAGCEQREDPLGAGGRLVVNGTDARPMLVAADNAAHIWTGSPGAKVLASTRLLAVVVAPDRQSVSIIDAATPDGKTVWSGQFGMDPDAAIIDDMVIIRDSNRGKL